MNKKIKSNGIVVFVLVALGLSICAVAPLISRSSAQINATTKNASNPKITYPVSKKVEQIDDYFGTKVADPYRWLEDETSAETKAWVEAQNKVTFAYLDKIPYREKLKARLTNSTTIRASPRRFVVVILTSSRRTTDCKTRASITFRKALTATPEVFLDPNKFSADGTSVLSAFSLSKDGKYLAYGISQGGSDWVTLERHGSRHTQETRQMKSSG